MAKVKGNSFEARERKAKKRSSIVKMSELREETIAAVQAQEAARAEVTKPVVEKEVPPVEVVKVTENVAPVAKVEEVKVEKVAVAEEIKPVVTETIEETKAPITHLAPQVESPKVETVVASEPKLEEVKEVVQNVQPATQSNTIVDNTNTNVVNDIKEINNEEIASLSVNEIKDNNENKDDFFNLNIKNDVFEGKITTVRVYDDILDLMKKYANMKNYQIIEFTNKVITMGLEDVINYDILQISEIKMKNNTSRSIMYNLTDTMEDKLNKYIKMMNKKGYKISRNVILNVILNETLKKFYV